MAETALFAIGTRCQARYMDGADWFEGTIKDVCSPGFYLIAYDDGDEEDNVPAGRLRVIQERLFSIGESVEALYGGGEHYFQGKVTSIHNQGEAYDIVYDDGDEEQFVKSKLIRIPVPTGEFPVGMGVEARYRGQNEWFSGTVDSFNGSTYTIKYNDGDFEDQVDVRFVRSPIESPILPAEVQPPPQPLKATSLPVPKVPVTTPPIQPIVKRDVYARFGGGEEYYLAVVESESSDQCDLTYHDGDVESGVSKELVLDMPRTGDRIEARFAGGSEWHTGVVASHEDGSYGVDYDDGDKERGVAPHLIRPIFYPVEEDENYDEPVQPFDEQTDELTMAAPKKSELAVTPTQIVLEPPAAQKAAFITPSEKLSPSKTRHLEVPEHLKKKFSDEEVQTFKQLFSLYDTDSSGAVDRQELSDILERLGESPDKDTLDALLAEADEDGDGEIDFQEFCTILHRRKDGVFGAMTTRVDKELNPAGVFRVYAEDALEKVKKSIRKLKEYAGMSSSRVPKDAFHSLEELFRLIPVCWDRTEKLIGLGLLYRCPGDTPPKHLRQKILALTDNAVELAKSKLTKDKVTSAHLKCIYEVLAAAKWVSIDFTGRMTIERIEKDEEASKMVSSPAGGVALPGMTSASSEKSLVRRMSATMLEHMAERESLSTRLSDGNMRRNSEAEYGPSNNLAAAEFLEGCREGLVFFSAKLRSPIQLDPSTQEGKLDALNREFSGALTNLLEGLHEYVKKYHPDGLSWQWQKVISKDESAVILQKAQQEEKKTALSLFKAAGKAVVASNRFGVSLKSVERRPMLSPSTPNLGEGVMRLGGTLFRQAVPEEMCVRLEQQGQKALQLEWPHTDREQHGKLFRRESGTGMGVGALLGKVSYWDDKMVETSKKKEEEEKTFEVTRRQSQASIAKEGKRDSMDISTANALILSACSDTTLLREAMAVVKKNRGEIAQTIDGGVATASIAKPVRPAPEAKIQWGGLVKANKFEAKVAEHNSKLQQEMEDAKQLKEAGQKNAKTFKRSSISVASVRVFKEDEEKEESKTEPVPAPQVRSEPLPGTLRTRPSYRMHDRMTAMKDNIETAPKPRAKKRNAKFGPGARVEGLFGGGEEWFLGRVVALPEDKGVGQGFVYNVLYDDGDSEQMVKESLLRSAPEMEVNVGDSVRGRYGGGMLYFPASVKAKTARGFDLVYNDGDEEYAVGIGMLAPVVMGLNEGAHVEARYGGGEDWFPAVIARVNGDKFDLHYDDGDFENDVPSEWIRQ